MTSPLGLDDVRAALPADMDLRIGTAVAVTAGVGVSINGTVIQCGFLDTTTTIGQPVAVLRCGSVWLCLGQVQTQP